VVLPSGDPLFTASWHAISPIWDLVVGFPLFRHDFFPFLLCFFKRSTFPIPSDALPPGSDRAIRHILVALHPTQATQQRQSTEFAASCAQTPPSDNSRLQRAVTNSSQNKCNIVHAHFAREMIQRCSCQYCIMMWSLRRLVLYTDKSSIHAQRIKIVLLNAVL
jgi:hypothetical protein